MRNARLAEWILSLVTTPERASATVGDLLEDRLHARGLRFWGAVLFAALSLLWRDLAASPLLMARLASLGLGLQLHSVSAPQTIEIIDIKGAHRTLERGI